MRRWLLEMSVLPELRVGDVLRTVIETHGGGPRTSDVTRACNQVNRALHGSVSSYIAVCGVIRHGTEPTGLVMKWLHPAWQFRWEREIKPHTSPSRDSHASG